MDRAIAKAKLDLSDAKAEEDYQSIGLFCREIIISVAQAVFDPKRHSTASDSSSTTDSQKMLAAFLQCELKGESNEELRAYAKSCLKLALAVHHRRTSTSRDAAIAIEAVSALAIIFGLLVSREDDWFTQSRSKTRKNAEWEYTCHLLCYYLSEHPVIKMASIKPGKITFSESGISVVVTAQSQKKEITFHKHAWWKPATMQNAQQIADALVLRALAELPQINELKS